MTGEQLMRDLTRLYLHIQRIEPDLLPTVDYLYKHIRADFPNWKKGPDWANFWTVDGGGVRMWWEVKPKELKSYDMEWSCDIGRRQVDEDEFYMINNWDKSLQERPAPLITHISQEIINLSE